ncbi:tyrosine-type recombinase/integrase [Pseudofulvibacter geojedonensis]|uniref:Tyrosine-type recombinase/integrase n=1 Tax=Pseudofulvibacter geojedonensis TaxID=1123758 RepID=A0ABW3I0B8_9FLAO
MQTTVLKLERDGDLKFALLIATGSYIGLRISDLLQLRWCDVINQEYFTIIEKKTKKERRITINPELHEILNRLFAKINPELDQYMFVNRFGNKPVSVQYVNNKLKQIFTKYGIKGQFSSHFMRKTLGRRVWEMNEYSDRALLLLSQLFNHASPNTTKIYLGIKEQEISNLYLSV